MRTLILALTALLGAGLIAFAFWVFYPFWESPPEIDLAGDPEHGEYVLRLGGCVTCHTAGEDGPFLAGGRELETPFGVFYTSNITPHPEAGIGGWSTGEFVQAMTEGLSPGAHHYYPAFPYTSYTNMTLQDLVDLKAYLDTVEPVAEEVPAHELDFPADLRPLIGGWKLLFFEQAWFEPEPERSEAWNRGAYIVNGPGHCVECHTPRNGLGALDRERPLAGNREGPEGDPVPNITPHEDDGIGGWSKGDIVFALQTGILPDGDVLGGAMNPVIEDSTSHLTREDLEAIAEYLLSQEPVPSAARADEGTADG